MLGLFEYFHPQSTLLCLFDRLLSATILVLLNVNLLLRLNDDFGGKEFDSFLPRCFFLTLSLTFILTILRPTIQDISHALQQTVLVFLIMLLVLWMLLAQEPILALVPIFLCMYWTTMAVFAAPNAFNRHNSLAIIGGSFFATVTYLFFAERTRLDEILENLKVKTVDVRSMMTTKTESKIAIRMIQLPTISRLPESFLDDTRTVLGEPYIMAIYLFLAFVGLVYGGSLARVERVPPTRMSSSRANRFLH